jgi:AbrB family looped-hinge helix DNA binding protein
MAVATMTSKGQITIPKEIRDSLRLHTGDRVAFLLQDPAGVLMKPATRSVDQVYGRLRIAGTRPRSVGEMDRAIAGRMKARRA